MDCFGGTIQTYQVLLMKIPKVLSLLKESTKQVRSKSKQLAMVRTSNVNEWFLSDLFFLSLRALHVSQKVKNAQSTVVLFCMCECARVWRAHQHVVRDLFMLSCALKMLCLRMLLDFTFWHVAAPFVFQRPL